MQLAIVQDMIPACPKCSYPLSAAGVCAICVALERVRQAREKARMERRSTFRLKQLITTRLPYKDT